jgi:hypothetical protein
VLSGASVFVADHSDQVVPSYPVPLCRRGIVRVARVADAEIFFFGFDTGIEQFNETLQVEVEYFDPFENSRVAIGLKSQNSTHHS